MLSGQADHHRRQTVRQAHFDLALAPQHGSKFLVLVEGGAVVVTGRQQLGVARSKDGVTWDKLRSNPILSVGPTNSFDEELGEPAVWSSGGWWWMLYTGRAHDERRRLGLARSRDGLNWARVQDFRIEGDQAWDSKVLADPTVEQMPDATIRVWFGGGDVASPDQSLHGQIGVGILH